MRIQEPDILRGLTKELGVKDRFGPTTVDDTVYPVAVVKDLTQPDRFLAASERLCMGGIRVSPVGVGFTGGLKLALSPGLQTLVTLHWIFFAPFENAGISANPFNVFFSDQDAGQSAVDRFLLNRRSFLITERPAASLFMFTTETPTSVGRIFTGSAFSEGMFIEFPRGFVMQENQSIAIAPESTAFDHVASFCWTERDAQLGR